MFKRRRILVAAAALPVVLVAAALATASGGGPADGADASRPRVVTSFYPLQFVAERVAGDLADIDNLTPPAADPHHLELSLARVRDVGNADLVVTLGGFMHAVDAAIEAQHPARVVDAADIVELLPASVTGGHSHDDGTCTHGHDHGHAHDHDHDHNHNHSSSDAQADEHDHEHAHAHAHDHGDGHSHSHDHSGSDAQADEHDHGDGHTHAHEHGDDHTHAHEHEDDDAHAETDDHAGAEDHTHEHAEGEGHAHGHSHDHSHDIGGYDPHFWLDPTRLAQLAGPVADALAEIDPANADVFRDNAAALEQELAELDAEIAEALAPFAGAKLVTNHTAFGYLAARYGIEQIGITGLDHSIEPSPARMREISDVVREHNVGTIFYETLVSPRVVQTLAGDLGVNAAVLDTLEGLTEDNAAAGEDFVSIMRSNLEALTQGLVAP